MSNTIYTYGYGGTKLSDLEWLVQELDAMLVDIRFQPRSGRPEWQRDYLRQVFRDRYTHIPALGNINYASTGKPIQINHMPTGIEKIRPILEVQPVILLCVCQSVATCHRRIVAETLGQHFAAEVIHLGAGGNSVQEPDRATAYALSIQQPWADLIVNGPKCLENREWKTSYRGPLYIHAGKRFDREGYEYIGRFYPDVVLKAPKAYDLGGIVGKAVLTDVVEESDDPWFEGSYAFVLEQRQPLPFVPCRGQLNIFQLEPKVVEALEAAA